MAYTDATQVSNFLQRALTAYETAELPNIIAAIKVWVDKRLNSTFDLATPTIRFYDGGVKNLTIDPCTAITQVQAINDDGSGSYTYTDTYEIVTEPQNETVKREIRKRLAAFPHGVHRIAVSATFSEYDGGVPADIQIMATRLASGVINSGKIAALGGNIAGESLEGHSITYNVRGTDFEGLSENDPTVKAIIDARREPLIDDYEPDRKPDYDDDDGGLMI